MPKALVIMGSINDKKKGVVTLGEASLDGVPIRVGLADCSPPQFDPDEPGSEQAVLIEVLAFSCNYRDRVLVRLRCQADAAAGPFGFGSDFVGVVRAVGREVESVGCGDRVVGKSSYPQASFRDAPAGVASNVASNGFLILHACKVAPIPEAMPSEVAAGFAVAAQTCYAMVRRLAITAGDRCVVTGASSNTGLFALRLLARRGVETYAVTTGMKDFGELGVAGTIRVKAPVDQSMSSNEVAMRLVRAYGGADCVIDCFADVYATSTVRLLRPGGRYITCGIFAQSGMDPGIGLPGAAWPDLFTFIIMNNITLHGNCLGSDADLEAAIKEYPEAGTAIPLDSVFGASDGLEFVKRSFLSADRCGKVVFKYLHTYLS